MLKRVQSPTTVPWQIKRWNGSGKNSARLGKSERRGLKIPTEVQKCPKETGFKKAEKGFREGDETAQITCQRGKGGVYQGAGPQCVKQKKGTVGAGYPSSGTKTASRPSKVHRKKGKDQLTQLAPQGDPREKITQHRRMSGASRQ